MYRLKKSYISQILIHTPEDQEISKKMGSMEISWGIVATTSLEGCTHRLADVGNRVHTRNDSDEDVRGNACNQAIAWKALP